METSAALIGVWDLLGVQLVFSDTGERQNMYGPNPVGRLILTSTGHMMALITAGERPTPNDQAGAVRLFDTMTAYSGKFRLEDGDKFITSCDLAWHPAWVGTDQVRFFSLERDRLSIRTAQQIHPKYPGRTGYGIIEWERASIGSLKT